MIVYVKLLRVVTQEIRIIPRKFSRHLQGVERRYTRLQCALPECRLVDLPLSVPEHIVDNRPGNAAVGRVKIPVDIPFSFWQKSIKAQLRTQRLHIAVATHSGSVVSHRPVKIHSLIAEFVTSVGIRILRTCRQICAAAKLLFPKKRRVCQPETAGAHLHNHIVAFSAGKSRASGCDIYGT